MGLVGNLLSSIFKPKVEDVPQVNTTARDLVSETSSQEAESPTMGSNKKPRKTKGISSLMVNKENTGSGAGTGINL